MREYAISPYIKYTRTLTIDAACIHNFEKLVTFLLGQGFITRFERQPTTVETIIITVARDLRSIR